MTYDIVTWNVNSIKMRLERVLMFCKQYQPDVLCLQELKCVKENFPYTEFEKAGYRAAVFGQKQYNGVAILAREEFVASIKQVFADTNQHTARWVEVATDDLHIVCLYAPNGEAVGSEKFAYKLKWYDEMAEYLRAKFNAKTDKIVLCGDFNIAPEKIDINPVALEQKKGEVLWCPQVCEKFEKIKQAGYHDFLRHKYPDTTCYSWWHYRAGAFPKNEGFRIDFTLVSEALLPLCVDSLIVRDERKKRDELKPSDHVPVILKIKK